MKKLIGSLVAVAGLAAAAHAQTGNTILDLQVSADGVNWSDSITVSPGAHVQMRARVSLVGATALGFSGINFQPTVNNWTAGDALAPFAATGSNSTTPAGSVIDQPGQPAPGSETSFFGRIRPFGAPNVVASNMMRGHTTDSGGTILRVAQNGTTNPIGSGSGSNNVNGSGGIPVSQSTGLFQPPATFVFGTTNVVIVKLGINLSSVAANRDLHVDAPTGGISVYGPNNDVRAGNWLLGHDPDTGAPITNYGAVQVDGADIHILVPTPASLALLGLGGLVAGRRRR
jgi:hypothetical protein